MTSAPLPDELRARIATLSPAKRQLLARLRGENADVGCELAAQALVRAGVSHVYGMPGIPVYDTYAACARAGIAVISTHHQQAAPMIASAQNYCAGRLAAAVVVSAGAATTNAATGVLAAYDNAWPLLVLAGGMRLDPLVDAFMQLDTLPVFAPITKRATRVRSTAELPGAIDDACRLAMTGRPGPVLLELPEDVLAGRAIAPVLQPIPDCPRPKASEVVVGQVHELLRRAERPLAILGKGLRWGDPFTELQALLEDLELPFVTSPYARGYVPDAHPLCANDVFWQAQAEADVVLVLGARLNWTFRHGARIPPEAALIQVDVHAGEFSRNRVPTLPIEADAADFVRRLRVASRLAGHASPRRHWTSEIRRRAEEARMERSREGGATPDGLSSELLARTLAPLLPDEAVLVLDGNATLAACHRHMPAHRPLSRLTPGTGGCMGTGVPYAIAAGVAWPGRPIVLVSGDFAFGLGALEMETALRLDVPLVAVVANNRGNGGVHRRAWAQPNGAARRTVQLGYGAGLRYDRMVEAMGGHGEQVTELAQLGPALQRALSSGRAGCIDVRVDPYAPFPRV